MTTHRDAVRSMTSLNIASTGNNAQDAVDDIIIDSIANVAPANKMILVNASLGQASTITIPDPGAATATFLLSTGASSVVASANFISPQENPPFFSAGTWTLTRLAPGNLASVHTAGANSPIVSIDITNETRVAALRGFALTGVQVVHSIGTLALTSATATINQLTYANNAAVVIAQPAFTGTLSTATQTNPYVDTLTITTPVYENNLNKMNIEIAYVCQATTALTFYGINLLFNKSIN